MKQNENGRQSSQGLLQTMTALQPKFHIVTMECDEIMTNQTHKVRLMDISSVSEGPLRKHPNPYPLVHVRGGSRAGGPAPILRTRRDRG